MKLRVPFHYQQTTYTCGPASLQMLFAYFKKLESQHILARQAESSPERGTDNSAMIRVATEAGFYVYVNDGSTLHEIKHFLEQGLPVIVNFIEPSDNEAHFAVVVGFNRKSLLLNDPSNGRKIRISHKEFLNRWYGMHKIHKKWIMVLSTQDMHFGRQYVPTGKLEEVAERFSYRGNLSAGAQV